MLEYERRRAAKALVIARREGTALKLDVMKVVVDGRGNEYGGLADSDKIRVRDLIFMAMGDDPPPGPQVPPPVAPADEKRKRWRIQTAVFSPSLPDGLWEMTRDDRDYIIERGTALLSSAAFGFLDDALAEAAKTDEAAAEVEEPPAE